MLRSFGREVSPEELAAVEGFYAGSLPGCVVAGGGAAFDLDDERLLPRHQRRSLQQAGEELARHVAAHAHPHRGPRVGTHRRRRERHLPRSRPD